MWAAVWAVGVRPPGSTAHVLLILLITVGKQTGNDDADNLEFCRVVLSYCPAAAVTAVHVRCMLALCTPAAAGARARAICICAGPIRLMTIETS